MSSLVEKRWDDSGKGNYCLAYDDIKEAVNDFNKYNDLVLTRNVDMKDIDYFRNKYDLNLLFGHTHKEVSEAIFGDFNK